LENVNVHIAFINYDNYWSLDEDTLREVLTHILPLISSVHSIQMDYPNIELFNMVYNTNNDDNDNSSNSSSNTDHEYSPESQLLLKEMMAQTQILFIDWLHERLFVLFYFVHDYLKGSLLINCMKTHNFQNTMPRKMPITGSAQIDPRTSDEVICPKDGPE
jgi:hypothetical protein